ncbi:MAG: hypothetical protein AB1432_10460 [Bacteroidota bacterium]|jgi:hypothetical protein
MKKYFLRVSIILSSVFYYNATAQVFSLKVDGKFMNGKVTEAVIINLGLTDYLQIRAESEDKIVYLYCKADALKGEAPVKLKFREPNYEKGEKPDSELIWVPEGPDNPQWNSISGETDIIEHDPINKTISGTFEFVVEKFQYSSKANKKRLSAVITNGIFSNVQYRIEEKKEGSTEFD